MLAEMAETLDWLSGGRLILGLGGGVLDQEFRTRSGYVAYAEHL